MNTRAAARLPRGLLAAWHACTHRVVAGAVGGERGRAKERGCRRACRGPGLLHSHMEKLSLYSVHSDPSGQQVSPFHSLPPHWCQGHVLHDADDRVSATAACSFSRCTALTKTVLVAPFIIEVLPVKRPRKKAHSPTRPRAAAMWRRTAPRAEARDTPSRTSSLSVKPSMWPDATSQGRRGWRTC
jgi:hypothetical protein